MRGCVRGVESAARINDDENEIVTKRTSEQVGAHSGIERCYLVQQVSRCALLVSFRTSLSSLFVCCVLCCWLRLISTVSTFRRWSHSIHPPYFSKLRRECINERASREGRHVRVCALTRGMRSTVTTVGSGADENRCIEYRRSAVG